jgi:integrase/recombinase XerC
MRKVSAPQVPTKLVPIIEDEDMSKMLDSSKGHLFNDKRDLATIRMLIDCGIRRGELCGLKVADVSFKPNFILVTGKYDRSRVVPFGKVCS